MIKDITLTIVGGFAAGIIGFYSAWLLYLKKEKRDKKIEKKELLNKLSLELKYNYLTTLMFYKKKITYENIETYYFLPLKNNIWNKVSLTDYLETGSDLHKEISFAYFYLECFNEMQKDLVVAKNNYLRDTNPENENKLKNIILGLNDIVGDLKDKLENAYKILEENIAKRTNK